MQSRQVSGPVNRSGRDWSRTRQTVALVAFCLHYDVAFGRGLACSRGVRTSLQESGLQESGGELNVTAGDLPETTGMVG